MPFTIQVPEQYRYLFAGMSPQDRAHNQVVVPGGTETGVQARLANLLQDGSLHWMKDADRLDLVKNWAIYETAEAHGQDVTEALSTTRGESGLTIPTAGPGMVGGGGFKIPGIIQKGETWKDYGLGTAGVIGTNDPIISNLAGLGDIGGPETFDPSVDLFKFEQPISSQMKEIERKALAALAKRIDINPDLQMEAIDSAMGTFVSAEGVMTANEMGASEALGELTTWDELIKDYAGDKAVVTDSETGFQQLHPVLLAALNYAGQQNGFISTQQVATIKAEADKAMVTDRIASDMALAVQQGSDETAIAEIRRDGDVDIANAQAVIEQARFATQQNLETLRVNAQLAQGTNQHLQIMAQLGLQESQRTEEYSLQNLQIEAAAAEGLRRYDLDEAESLRRFELQQQEFTTQAALEREAREAEAEKTQLRFEQQKLQDELRFEEQKLHQQVQLDQQQKDLEQQQLNFTIQIERDKITAQTNKDIAVIQREQAGNTDEANRQIAQRQSEEREQLALLDQLTTLGVGAQQLEATLAGTQAQIDISSAQIAAQKETQLAIQALQDSAAIDELDKAKEIGLIHANAQKESQLAIQTLRETTILGELDRHKAIAALQQEMQITAQAATAALQANQGISELEKEEAIATIQETTRQATNVAIAELQASTEITALEKQEIIAGLQASATTTAATTQAGAITGAAALQAEAAGPFGYVGAGVDPTDRAQRLTDAQSILGAQYNPYDLTNTQFTGMQDVAAQAGATPFGALATAPDARYQDILGVQQAQAAAGPFQAAQLGQGMGDISTILRGGLTPEQQLALAQAPGNPFGFTANEAMALQNSLARGGLSPEQRLTEVQAGAAPQNMANYLNFIGNPAAVGFAGQSGFLQNMADSPEGNLPASLFGLNVPQNAPTVPTNPTMADLTDLTDEQLGFYQGQQAAQNYQTPSQIFQQAQMVTPQGV